MGSERVLFGSDIPFGTMKGELLKVLSLKVGGREKENILGGNLKRLTRVEEKSPFDGPRMTFTLDVCLALLLGVNWAGRKVGQVNV